MFALVDRVEDYPQYVPWCVGSEVSRDDASPQLLATLHLQYGTLRHSFTTQNEHDATAEIIRVKLARGPLSFLHGEWRFLAHGEGGCRIEFEIDYEFSNRILTALLSPMFAAVYDRMIHAFAQQSHKVYGGESKNNDDQSS